MKFIIGLLVAFLALNAVSALPARPGVDTTGDAEVIDVDAANRNGGGGGDGGDNADNEPDFKDFKGIIDTGIGFGFLAPPQAPGIFATGYEDPFESFFRRLRQRLIPLAIFGTSDDAANSSGAGSSEEGGLATAFGGKDGNSTSTVKVIDGHKVEVNETVFGDSNNIFKVRVINIRPLDSDEDVEEGVQHSEPNPNGANPATSAPPSNGGNGGEGGEGGNGNGGGNGVYSHEADNSVERREPLEQASKHNEVRGDIDGPEVTF